MYYQMCWYCSIIIFPFPFNPCEQICASRMVSYLKKGQATKSWKSMKFTFL